MEFKGNQKKVIEHGKGVLLVEAGPGSGKTTVIVERIKELIKKGVDPESFLVITFTNKAADNLKYKLRNELEDKDMVLKMQVSTIHSFCLEYLKSKDMSLTLIDDDASEKKTLFIKKFSKKLGFTGYSKVFDYHVPDISNKFKEYGSFNVDSQKLFETISASRGISQDYMDFVDSMDFFTKKRIDDHDAPIKDEISDIVDELKEIQDESLRMQKEGEIKELEKKLYTKSWYNARFLQIIQAYPIYLELLDEYNYVDYNTVQIKALKELQKNPNTKYKTIFVDEFQDTDPLQFRIFQILKENCDYFTAVGDVDQHIYAFRSSFNDFFDELIRLEKPPSYPLNINFRSSKNIVDLTEEFINPQRKETSEKKMKSNREDFNNPNFLLENKNSAEEAQNIYEIIQYLMENNIINDYSDVAILYRKHRDKTIAYLVDKFNEAGIGFSIKGQKDLSKQDEVKSILTLLWYVSRRTYLGHIPSSDELKEFNLKAFCGNSFNPSLWRLDESTIEYLNGLQKSFDDEVIRIENELRAKRGASRVSAVHRIRKNETQDALIEIFQQVQVPLIDLEEIRDPTDREFFRQLENIRNEIKSEEPPTLLKVFYKLIALSNLYNLEMSYSEIANLAILTQTLSNYESIISETDVRGVLFFLMKFIENYDSYQKEGSGVQLMTIHSAKGLEFPVTIINSLNNEKFPIPNKDPKRESDYIFPSDTYYTPNECLDYKTILKEDENGNWVHKTLSIDEENSFNDEEEERVIYVGMTRAEDLLILSTIGEVPDAINKIRNSMTIFSFEELGTVEIQHDESTEDDDLVDDLEQLEEPVVLNYSRYTKYLSCPFKYDLDYNLGFKRFGSAKAANRGSVFHEIMEKVNLMLMEGNQISKEGLGDLTFDLYNSMFAIKKLYESSMEELSEEEKKKITDFEEFKKNVEDYYYKYSLEREVLGAEYDFEIFIDNYILNGSVDLIYRDSDGEVVILDYKYAQFNEEHIGGYIKQSYIYALALSKVPEYGKLVKKAIIHFVLGDGINEGAYQYEVEIDEETLKLQLADMDEVSKNIKEDIFEKEPEKIENCAECAYRYFCKPKEFAEELYEN